MRNEGGWRDAARVLIAPPERWQDVNFHSVMKCIDVLKFNADDCKAARDLRLTEKKINEERAFLNNDQKKQEIRQGFIDKKRAAAAAAVLAATKDGVACLIQTQSLDAVADKRKRLEHEAHDKIALELEADAKVAAVLAAKEIAIGKNVDSLPQKRQAVRDSEEVKLFDCVERVWKACGAAAIHDEFQALDRCARG